MIFTQEKWDHMTRRWRDHISVVQLTRLFLIDEVNLSLNSKTCAILWTYVHFAVIKCEELDILFTYRSSWFIFTFLKII